MKSVFTHSGGKKNTSDNSVWATLLSHFHWTERTNNQSLGLIALPFPPWATLSLSEVPRASPEEAPSLTTQSTEATGERGRSGAKWTGHSTPGQHQ